MLKLERDRARAGRRRCGAEGGRHGNGDGGARLFHVLVTDKAGCCVPAARRTGAMLTVMLPYGEDFS